MFKAQTISQSVFRAGAFKYLREVRTKGSSFSITHSNVLVAYLIPAAMAPEVDQINTRTVSITEFRDGMSEAMESLADGRVKAVKITKNKRDSAVLIDVSLAKKVRI